MQTIQAYQEFEEENHELHAQINDLEEANQELSQQVQSYAAQLKNKRDEGIFFFVYFVYIFYPCTENVEYILFAIKNQIVKEERD